MNAVAIEPKESQKPKEDTRNLYKVHMGRGSLWVIAENFSSAGAWACEAFRRAGVEMHESDIQKIEKVCDHKGLVIVASGR